MGTLAKTDAKPKFDGTVKMWPLFKEAMLKWADGEGFGYMLEGGQGICTIFQAASAASAKKTKGDDKGTISLDITAYDAKTVASDFKKTSVTTSVSLAVRTNRKDQLGANWADHEKCEMSETDLSDAHEVLDAENLRQVNRSLTPLHAHVAVIMIRGSTHRCKIRGSRYSCQAWWSRMNM